MRSFFKQYGFIVFLLIALLHLAAIGFDLPDLRFVTKPLLMPVLALTVYGHSSHSTARTIFIIALLCSFLGDVFLMFEYKNPLYFIVGLVSFLMAHILYIIFFAGIKKGSKSLFKMPLWLPALVMAYGLFLLFFLWPGLGELKIPVTVYAAVICIMLISAMAVYKSVNKTAANYFLLGAFSFVASDSILAINKFYQAFSPAPILIMLSYCAAQYYLAKGFVAQPPN
jgi:uncharacterized membrane protein YhhN